MATSVTILDGPTIAQGESLSDAIDCSAGRIVRITMPQEWTDADLSFQISTDGVFFNNLFRPDGGEYMVVADAARAIIINQMEWLPGLWLKFRSGSSVQPRVQAASRTFAIALLVEAP